MAPVVHEISPSLAFVQGNHVNWTVLRDGDDVTLIDGGYPGDAEAVLAALDELGHRGEDVRGALLTHAHVDHLGGLAALSQRFGFPVYAGSAELANAQGRTREQAGPLDVARRAWRPRVARWAWEITRSGGTQHPVVEAVAVGEAVDLPGAPRAVATPGHTSGHTAYLLAADGAVVTGDALVTGHPLSSIRGPQLLPDFFTHRADGPHGADAALDVIAGLEADTILPGHGPGWTGSLPDAVERARSTAGDRLR